MRLTPREQQILALLSTGRTYKEVGTYLGITVNTVRTRVRCLYPKLNAHSVAEAVMNYERARYELPDPQGWVPRLPRKKNSEINQTLREFQKDFDGQKKDLDEQRETEK